MIETHWAFALTGLGLVAGWWIRSRRDMPERMRLVERFDRRARLAEAEHETAIRTLNEGQIEVRRIQGLFGGLNERVAELEAEVLAANNAASANKKDLLGREQELAAITKNVAALRNTNETLAEKLRVSELARNEATAKAADADKAMRAAEANALELEEESERTSERVRVLTERSDEADRLESTLAEVQAALAEHRTENADLKRRIESVIPLEEELERCKAELEASTERADALDVRVAELEPQNASLSADLDEARDVGSREQSRAESAEEELAAATARIEELDTLTERLKADLAEVRETLAEREGSWRDQNASVTARAGRAEEDLAAARARVAELEPLTERLKSDADEAREDWTERESTWREKTESLSARAERAEEDLALAKARVAELEPMLDELARTRGTLTEKETHWEAASHRARAQAERAEKQLAEVRAKADELNGAVALLQANEKRAEKELASLEQRLAKREQEVDELKDAKAEAKRLSSEAERIPTLEERLAARDAELEVLRDAKASANRLATDVDRAKKAETGLEKRLDKERTLAESMREKVLALTDSAAKQRVEIEEWKERVAQLSSSHKAIQLKSDRYSKRIADLEKDVATKKERLAAAVNDKRERDVQARALEAKLKKAEAAAERTAAQLERARAGKAAKAKPAPKKAKPIRDDLQELAGVGPALAKKLSRAGFRAYGDIARLDKEGLEALAEKVGVSPQAVRKNRWVSTASRLHKAKYGTPVA